MQIGDAKPDYIWHAVLISIKWNREMCSRVDMQTHVGRLELGFDLWPFDLRVSACRGPAMYYMSTDFGADSSSRFPFEARTNRQTNRRDWTLYPTPAVIQPAWEMIGFYFLLTLLVIGYKTWCGKTKYYLQLTQRINCREIFSCVKMHVLE